MKELKKGLRRTASLSLLLLSSLYSLAQSSFTVTGKVTDETGKPLQGVTVQVKKANTATTTKEDGSYSITAPSGNSVLVFSSVGFGTKEVPLNNRNSLDLSLSTAANALEDVVVVGYGTQKKSDVTGSL